MCIYVSLQAICEKEAMTEEILGYLDHNILDSIRKGDPFDIKALLRKKNITPIYSQENLKEIKRSVGSEDIFLNVLNGLGSKYIQPIYENHLPTGSAEITDDNIFEIWKRFIENEDPMPEYGYGFSSMLEKFYGGRSDETFSEIFLKGNDELKVLLDDAIKDIEFEQGFTDEMRAAVEMMPDILNEQYQQISSGLDSQVQPILKQYEQEPGLGAKVLKNIKPPKVVEKVFDAVEKSMVGVELDIGTFFGISSLPHESNQEREKFMFEKVNAIYHQLNFLGYYRDSDMKKTRGFVRHFSDMTHAGTASFCHLLLCRDTGLVKKAEAAYEYLGVGTIILHFQDKKRGKLG